MTGSESLGSDYEQSKLNSYQAGGNPQMGEYDMHNIDTNQYGQYA